MCYLTNIDYFVLSKYSLSDFLAVFRYRVEIMVCHNKESGNFVFWDRDCTLIIGMSASELRKLMKEANIHIEIVLFSLNLLHNFH